MPKKNQHVVPHPEGWAVKPEGGEKASSIHDTRAGVPASSVLFNALQYASGVL